MEFFLFGPLVSWTLVLALFAMIPVFAARHVVAMISPTPAFALVPGIADANPVNTRMR